VWRACARAGQDETCNDLESLLDDQCLGRGEQDNAFHWLSSSLSRLDLLRNERDDACLVFPSGSEAYVT
jgi:hypothetical protein